MSECQCACHKGKMVVRNSKLKVCNNCGQEFCKACYDSAQGECYLCFAAPNYGENREERVKLKITEAWAESD